MVEGPRSQAERERQLREKRLFLTVAGLGFAASMLGAVALGHRRAHKAAMVAGESIGRNDVGWAMRAFGLGTLYALGFVGCATAAGSYYLQSRGLTTMGDVSEAMRSRVARSTGRTVMERLGISPEKDMEDLARVDRALSEVDEQTGEKKIRFERVKSFVRNSDPGSDGSQDGEQRLSVGARMRRIFGFGANKGKGTSTDEGAGTSTSTSTNHSIRKDTGSNADADADGS
ncbi:hypothetical protein GGI07_004234 [Coemansia sp. Benny D115]|nr:hypothetical protein GGI07_004234 [Coemansia sp. Benny D115]